jgi:hypothetical protein
MMTTSLSNNSFIFALCGRPFFIENQDGVEQAKVREKRKRNIKMGK